MSVKFFHIMLLVKDSCNPSISRCKRENVLIEKKSLPSQGLACTVACRTDIQTELELLPRFLEKTLVPELDWKHHRDKPAAHLLLNSGVL